MRSRCLWLALVVCLALVASPAARPVRADCGLNNNGFEGGFADRFGDGHVWVANGWEFWYQDGPDQSFGKNWRPSYGSFDTGYLGGKRVHGGTYAQKFGNSWATHNAGLFQRVAVPAHSKVTFTAWAQAWSSDGDDTNSVTKPGNYRLSVGIDPTGGTNWAASSVRWSEPRVEYNTWVQLSISAEAEGGAVTVFVRGNPEFPVKHNESSWDDLCLQVIAPTAPPPPPTAIPRPTNTPTKTSTPTNTPTGTPTATPVLSSICVQSYNDKNGNGTRDAGEELLTGARITLFDDKQAEVASYTTTGAGEPYCFKVAASGRFTLKEQDPAGYQSTTPNDWGVIVAPGSSAQIDFGERSLPTATPRPATATPVPTPTPAPASTGAGLLGAIGRGLYGVSGILVALLAVGLFLGMRTIQRSE